MVISWVREFVRKSPPLPPVAGRGRLRLDGLEDRTVPSFFNPPTYAVGTTPVAPSVGDFNGDGKLDFAVVNEASNTVSVLVGNGDGAFRPAVNYATGTTPVSIAVGDLNGDGHLDLVVANANPVSNTISLMLGNGDGTFLPRTDLVLPLTPKAVTLGDFNGDGKADIAVASGNTTTDDVTMLLGNGNGTFQAPVTTVTDSASLAFALYGGRLSAIQSADFNGDGHLDLVVVNNKDTPITGRFGAVIGSQPQAGTVSVLLGNGDGTFQAPRNATAGTSPSQLAVGDFNGDGRPDYAVSGAGSIVSVFTNAGGGNFTSSTIVGVAGSLAAADFNGDGVADLAVTTFGSVKLFDGQAGGMLQAGPSYVLGLGSAAAGDFNGDGHLDLAGSVFTSNFTYVVEPWLNNGNGTFQAPTLISGASGVTLSTQAAGDFNGDGIPDLATASGQVELGLGDGRFGDVSTLTVPGSSSVAAVDADGNGTVDILVGNPGYPTGQVALWPNSLGYDSRTGGAVAFTVSAPTQIAAGDNTSVTITAVDALGNPVPGFLGTVDLDFTPAGSTALNLASQYTFTAADNGRHTFLFSNVTQPGAGTLSVHAAGMPIATAPLTVVAAVLSQFAFAGPGPVPAGTPFSFTVTAEDRFGNVETGYTGTVHFSAQVIDTQAVLPADYTFTAANAGTQTFTAVLFKTASPFSPFVNAKDLATGVNTSGSIAVTPLAPANLIATGFSSPYTAGTAVPLTVTAVDVYGNRATGYTGTIHFSSSDPQASLPGDYTFSAADGGQHTFPATLKTAGAQSFGVADTVNPAFSLTQSGILVNPAPASVFAFTGTPVGTVAGTPVTLTVTATDAYGNRSPYFGTVSFSSSDAQAGLPGLYAFTVADASSHTFTATLKTAGPQAITVNDAFSGVPTGTQQVAVTPAAAASFTVAGFPAATTAGVAHTVTVTARDSFGNMATAYTGTVAVTSSDPIASLPANYTFTAADSGVHTFPAALKRAGTQFIQVADTLSGGINGAESGIAVTPAAVTHFLITGPTTVTQGVGFKVTVSAVDDFGNVNPGYRGTVHLSSTDATGGTQNFTFSNNDNGVHIFSYTFNALGFQTLSIVDTANSSILGSFTVNVLHK